MQKPAVIAVVAVLCFGMLALPYFMAGHRDAQPVPPAETAKPADTATPKIVPLPPRSPQAETAIKIPPGTGPLSEEEIKSALKSVPPLPPQPPPSQTYEQAQAEVNRNIAAHEAAVSAAAAGLPQVKRIFSCDEKPAPEAIVDGLDKIQHNLPLAECGDGCDFQQIDTWMLRDATRCSLRNSLAFTPNQLKASYPPNLLRSYVDRIHDLRRQYPDWQKFSEASEEVRNRLKEYLWTGRCGAAKIGIGGTAFTDTVDACDAPYFTMVRSANNLDGSHFAGGNKYDSYYWRLLDIEETKDGDLLIADYADLRYYPPKADFFLLKESDLSLTPVTAEKLDPFTGKVGETDELNAVMDFDPATGRLGAGGMNVHVGTSWAAQYHLEGSRFVLDEVAAGVGFKEPRIIFRHGGEIDPAALVPADSNLRTNETYIHDPKSIERFKDRRPPLTQAQKAQYIAVLTGSDAQYAQAEEGLRQARAEAERREYEKFHPPPPPDPAQQAQQDRDDMMKAAEAETAEAWGVPDADVLHSVPDPAGLRARAVAGDAKAQFQLNDALLHQWIPLEDGETTDQWLMKSAAAGDARAEERIAFLYLDQAEQAAAAKHPIAPEWFKTAAENFRKAADQGRPMAQAWLGKLYARGQGVEHDDAEAYFWCALGGDEKTRDDAATKLSPEQVDAQKKRLDDWKSAHPK
jgi:TPR repeat protein